MQAGASLGIISGTNVNEQIKLFGIYGKVKIKENKEGKPKLCRMENKWIDRRFSGRIGMLRRVVA